MSTEYRRTGIGLVRLGLAVAAVLGTWGPAPTYGQGPSQSGQDVYFPEPGDRWERRSPEEVGMAAELLEDAIAYVTDPEHAGFYEDLELQMLLYPPGEPMKVLSGPTKPRGPMTGMIVRHGYIVAEWGDPYRVDMTFSVTKSFLSTTVGLAYDRGLIEDVHDPVYRYMAPITAVRSGGSGIGSFETFRLFGTEHNRKITWDHMLRQTSDWEGTLWGRPDWVDRPRGEPSKEWATRPRHEPGTVYKYNDVRVNALALATLNIWRRPLPEVLEEYVMDPIGASDTWRWHGYENSWVVIDGRLMQSVSGGGHWGGGMWISARDQARFGYLFLRNGRWEDGQILSDEWIEMAKTPGDVNPTYGFMNYSLNGDRRRAPAAPESAFWHSGGGINRIYIDPVHDLVVVVRWLDGQYFGEFIARVLASMDGAVSEEE